MTGRIEEFSGSSLVTCCSYLLSNATGYHRCYIGLDGWTFADSNNLEAHSVRSFMLAENKVLLLV